LHSKDCDAGAFFISRCFFHSACFTMFFDSVYSTANRCSQLRFFRPTLFVIVKMIAYD